MKQWVRKLLAQLDIGDKNKGSVPESEVHLDITDERATLLYFIDLYNRHLFEMEKWPVRKVREILDEFSRQLVNVHNPNQEKLLFRLRQFFSSYRIDEFTYVQNTFDDFKNIVWDFADQLAEDIRFEQNRDIEVRKSLEQLREAVEANSIDELKNKSREFIDFYVSYQTQKDLRRSQRLDNIQRNLTQVKKRLAHAEDSALRDHLTRALNRKGFDEVIHKHIERKAQEGVPCSLLLLDIDHFKKVNDTYGHDIGDKVLVRLVELMESAVANASGVVARLGGEEFAILLPGASLQDAVKGSAELLDVVRKEVLKIKDHKIQFTISIGVSQLLDGETRDEWLKRTDIALYESKHNGRNRYSLAYDPNNFNSVA